ncbi:MAG: sensor histidine kinase, partial [Spirochaetaceae bacterium]
MISETVDRTANVRVLGSENLIRVPITSSSKPEIPSDFEDKWQEIVTLAARIIKVPAGLIMRLHENEIEVFASSTSDGNPYEEKERAELGLGLYCETVVGRREELLVPHALEDPDWETNPDVELDMFSYLGVPVRWPDGEVFGTFCVLDRKRNEYDQDQRHLVHRLAELVESDLKILVHTSERLEEAELQAKELRHRIKNQFNLLISYIDLHSDFSSASNDHASVTQAVRVRIETLAKLHHQMSRLEAGAKVPLLDSLNEVAALIVSSSPFDVRVSSRGDKVLIDERILVPAASILNELVTNSIKHAFHGVRLPEVTIGVYHQESGLCIEYSDNGTESGVHAEHGSGSGLGSLIVSGLAAQLSAEIEQHGFEYRICIPNNLLGSTE